MTKLRSRRAACAGVLMTLGSLVLAGCGANGSSSAADGSSGRVVHVVGEDDSPGAYLASSGTAKVSKVLVFVVENHSLAQMKASMPATFALARRYAYATDYHAIRHPSLPNYLAIASGSTHGVTDDHPPTGHGIAGPTVLGTAVAAGRSAALYAEGMRVGNCSPTNEGRYVARHNPWTYFPSEHAACARFDKPFARFGPDVEAGRLPTVGFVIPDQCHNAHDCSLSVADRWFAARMRTIQAGPDWRSGHLAVVLTADEDDGRDGNRVLTVVANPSLHGRVVGTRLTHYSLSCLLSDVAHTTPLGSAKTAPSMNRAFGFDLA